MSHLHSVRGVRSSSFILSPDENINALVGTKLALMDRYNLEQAYLATRNFQQEQQSGNNKNSATSVTGKVVAEDLVSLERRMTELLERVYVFSSQLREMRECGADGERMGGRRSGC